MSLLFLDFETRSEADLPSVGAYRYAEHPSTEVLCAAYAVGDLPVGLVTAPSAIQFMFDIGKVTVVAHNVEFEKSILREVLGIDLPIDRFIDTAAMSARMSLPRKLEDVARFFKLDTEAKDAGKKAIQALSKPRKPSRSNPDKWWTRETRPELFAMLEARCVQDVELTRTIYKKLLKLEAQERRIWQVTIAMNERGLKIDRAAIEPARQLLEKEARPLVAEFEGITGRPVKSYAKVAEVLGLPDVRKPTVRKALRGEPIEWETEHEVERFGGEVEKVKTFHRFLATAPKLRALEIFQMLSKSSVAKLEAMLDRMGADDRVRGSFIYAGAERTLRWSANGIQPQNFPRGLGKETDGAFAALFAEVLEDIFLGAPRDKPEPPLTITSTIANMLRGFILGPLIVGDLAQIEARALNWLAGQHDKVAMFAEGRDLYSHMASRVYGRPINKKDHPAERFMGKQMELGAGYGLGWRGFQSMLDETYDVQVDDAFSERAITAYRESAPAVVSFWDRLAKGLMHVVRNKRERVQVTKNLAMGYSVIDGTPFAWIELPNGRKLYYAEPTVVVKKPKFKGAVPREVVEYFGRDRFSGGWTRVSTYGGKIAENVTQAFSREVIACGMLRLHDAGFHLCGTVHDELIAEDEPTPENEQRFHDLLVEVPEWAAGLPLEAEVFSGARYRK